MPRVNRQIETFTNSSVSTNEDPFLMLSLFKFLYLNTCQLFHTFSYLGSSLLNGFELGSSLAISSPQTFIKSWIYNFSVCHCCFSWAVSCVIPWRDDNNEINVCISMFFGGEKNVSCPQFFENLCSRPLQRCAMQWPSTSVCQVA